MGQSWNRGSTAVHRKWFGTLWIFKERHGPLNRTRIQVPIRNIATVAVPDTTTAVVECRSWFPDIAAMIHIRQTTPAKPAITKSRIASANAMDLLEVVFAPNACVSDRRQRAANSGVESSVEAASC
jgi:hypothetical protein